MLVCPTLSLLIESRSLLLRVRCTECEVLMDARRSHHQEWDRVMRRATAGDVAFDDRRRMKEMCGECSPRGTQGHGRQRSGAAHRRVV
jgi:hypothetical protein